MSFKKFDGSTWQPITPKKLKGVPYTGTLPATLTGTKAGYLHRYKIYGNTEQTGTPTPENPIMPQECGERTENLFDKDAAYTKDAYLRANNSVAQVPGWAYSNYISVTGGEQYTLSNLQGISPAACFYDNSYNFVSGQSFNQNTTLTLTAPSTVKYVRISFCYANNPYGIKNDDTLMLNSGSTAPTSYIPYGYKLPLTSGSTPVDIYIGDDTLSADEYVDSGTGKIYRIVDGVLTPVDPPVPFPQIPTSAGSTTIGWAGEGFAPSEFDSIQEWVDIPTYTYTNGAWVEDN